MKKILKTMALATMGLFALASCEDVPAPYITPGNGGGNGENAGTSMATVDFTQGTGGWTTQDKSGLAGVWSNSGSYGMVASGFKSSKNNASESWLVSPEIDLTGASEVVLVVDEAVNKIGDGKVEEMMTVWASNDDGATWQQLAANKRPAGSSWTFQEDAFDLAAYSGQKVKVAFKYISTAESAGTWEIKSVSLKGKGTATIEGGGDAPAGIEVTCAQAVELTNALGDGETSTELYTVTGYITEVVGAVSRNQQTFWMADTKAGGRVFEAYYANLPEGLAEFKAGAKVKITGYLMKYVNTKTGQVTPESKNPNVVILEDGGDTPTPSGTDVTCAQAVELTNALADGATSTDTYTVTGYITEVVGAVSTKTDSPQQSFWMADTKAGGRVFEAYYANLPEGLSEFTTGMKVKITGQLTKYVKDGNVTAEIKNPTVEIIENGGGGDTPTGNTSTFENPYTVAQALAIINAGTYTNDKVYVKGKVSQIDEISTQYGNATYYISDDGNTANQLEVYRGKGLGGESFTSDDDLLVGDEVIVYGALTLYKDKNGNETPEITSGSQIVSLNGETSGTGGGGETPTGSDITCAKAVELTNALSDGATSTEAYNVTGYITEVVGAVSTKTGSPQQTFWMADTKDGGRVFEAYYANVPEGVSEFKAGMKVKITGNLTKYVKDGNVTAEIKNPDVVVLENGGGDNPNPSGGDTSSITFSEKGYSNAQDFDGQTITVGDATLSFSKGTGSTTPKYYSTGTAMRLYGGNTLTISSGKTIAKVEFTYNGGADYTPTAQTCTVTPGTYDFSSHVWTGSAKSIVLSNTASKGHFRLASVVITYAE